MQRSKNIVSFFSGTLLACSAAAADYQSHASIHEAARLFMLNHVKSIYEETPEIKAGYLDSRLNLRACTQPIEAFLPDGNNGIGKITVGVKCADHKPWSLYVPITVSLFRDVLVAAEPLPSGKVLEKEDLKQARYDLAGLPNGYITNFEDSVGLKLKRPLTAGSALTPAMVAKPRLITRGQRITIMAQSGGMTVRTSGKALAHGAAGERISVQNTNSKRKLEGIITPSGEVEIDL